MLNYNNKFLLLHYLQQPNHCFLTLSAVAGTILHIVTDKKGNLRRRGGNQNNWSLLFQAANTSSVPHAIKVRFVVLAAQCRGHAGQAHGISPPREVKVLPQCKTQYAQERKKKQWREKTDFQYVRMGRSKNEKPK